MKSDLRGRSRDFILAACRSVEQNEYGLQKIIGHETGHVCVTTDTKLPSNMFLASLIELFEDN